MWRRKLNGVRTFRTRGALPSKSSNHFPEFVVPFTPGRAFFGETKGIMNNPLNEYTRTGSGDAFRQIVESHINTVYSQCLRKLHNTAQAEDVTQVVFAILAQKAAKLPANVVLEGWLFTTARFCCSSARRAAGRRTASGTKGGNHEK